MRNQVLMYVISLKHKSGNGDPQATPTEFSTPCRPHPFPRNSQDCSSILAEWADLRCRTLLPAKGMGDARRNDILSTSDPRAWERLVEPSSQKPTPPVAVDAAAAEPVIQVGQENQGDRHLENLQYTTVPMAEDIDRVRSELVLLRDSILAPAQPQTEGSTSIFDNFEAKNSSRSSRWDAWQALPPWSVCSSPGCPLAEVGQ